MSSTSPPVRHRPTADLVVLFLTAIVGLVVVTAIVGAIVWKVTDDDADLANLTARVGDIVNTLIGAIVGFIAGKGAAATATLNGHGQLSDTPGPSLPDDHYGE